MQATVGPVQSLIDQWTQQGITLPVPLSGKALIDTRASVTCIDDAIAQQLGLPVIDVVPMISASHVTQQNVYPIQFIVGGQLIFNVERALGANLAAQGLILLIGRDVLQTCTLHYNGAAREFTLALWRPRGAPSPGDHGCSARGRSGACVPAVPGVAQQIV